MKEHIDKKNCSFNDLLSSIEENSNIESNDDKKNSEIEEEQNEQEQKLIENKTISEDNNNVSYNIAFNGEESNTILNEQNNDSTIINDNYEDNLNVDNNYSESNYNTLDNNEKNIDNKNKIISFFNNKKIYTILIILIFILSCVLVGKTFYLRNKLDNYEELIITVEKEEEDIKVYSDIINSSEVINKGAANELINCLNTQVDTNNLPENINNVIKEINNYYNSSNDYFAFVYKDIFSGFTVSYNENQNIFTASAIKGPTDIYIYEMASLGKVDLDEELTYTPNYYNTGSGLLKNKKLNTKYTVRTLLEYSTVYSDNAAHNMLTDRFGRENMYNFWKEKGTTAIFSQNSNWGVLNAKDSSIYMEELYNFYIKNKEYGSAVMNNFTNAIPKFISSDNNYLIANKSGWSGSVLHDVAIVFADNPYIVVALSNTGATPNYMDYFNTVSALTYKLHTEYWKYKMNICENIKQY